MSNVSKLDMLRKADKDREIELCQTIIDACETLGQIAQERGDGEYEMHWSRMSGMALDGPPKTNDCYPDFGFLRKLRWAIYNLAFTVFGKTRVWQRMGRAIWN